MNNGLRGEVEGCWVDPTAETVTWENCMKASATVTATKGSSMDAV